MAGQAQAEERVGYMLKRAQQALRTAMDEALRQHGVTTAQYAALSALEEDTGLSGAALARRCFVTPQTMHEIVAHLETAGLVLRQRGDDARVLRTCLTPAGRHLVRACHQTVAAIEERLASRLSPRERRQFLAHLRRCVAALDGAPEPTVPPVHG